MTFVIQRMVLKLKSVLFVVLWLVPLGGQLDLIFNPQPCTLHKTVKILTRNYKINVARLLDLQDPIPSTLLIPFSLALISQRQS